LTAGSSDAAVIAAVKMKAETPFLIVVFSSLLFAQILSMKVLVSMVVEIEHKVHRVEFPI